MSLCMGQYQEHHRIGTVTHTCDFEISKRTDRYIQTCSNPPGDRVITENKIFLNTVTYRSQICNDFTVSVDFENAGSKYRSLSLAISLSLSFAVYF